jgi:hypothetical protein
VDDGWKLGLIHKILAVEFLLRLNNEPNEPLPQMILVSREGRETGEGIFNHG